MPEEKSGIASNLISLPKSGGVQGFGQAFQIALSNGTGNYQIPLDLPAGRHNMTPTLTLTYNSVGGNSPFGMGWGLGILRVDREYQRDFPDEEPTRPDYVLAGSDHLVPVGDNRYRPIIERDFSRIVNQGDHWEVTTRNGARFLLGVTAAGRIEHDGTVFSWLIEQAVDPQGNEIGFSYLRDQEQLYLQEIQYGIYRILFEYEGRPDHLEDRRRAFVIKTRLRCQSIDVYCDAGDVGLIRTYALRYDAAPLAELSLLASVTLTARRTSEGQTEELALPPVSFEYTPFEPAARSLRTFTTRAGAPPPPPLDPSSAILIDLTGGALPGVLELANGTARYWRNRGRLRWDPPRRLPAIPAEVQLGDPAVWFLDMEGNGTVDLAVLSGESPGYYPNSGREAFDRRVSYVESPRLDFSDPMILANTRFLDLNHDRVIDLLYSGPEAFYAFINRGRDGWAPPVRIPRQHDPEQFPDVFFADGRVRLADMTGDGIQDIVLVHSRRIDYWPYLGAGRWGQRVRIENAPELPRNWRAEHLFFADVNGDAVADLVYVGADGITYAINRQGRAFAEPQRITSTPRPGAYAIQMVDMTGDGSAGVLWSSQNAARRYGNAFYLDFVDESRPYLLSRIDNHLGLVTEISYSSSTEAYVQALEERRAWETFLPMGVATVSRVATHDAITGVERTSEARYFNGHYDGRDRTFCGFGLAEMVTRGDESMPDLLVRHQFHLGQTDGLTDEADKARARALRQFPFRRDYIALDGSDPAGQLLKVEEVEWGVDVVEEGTDGRVVATPRLMARETRHLDGTGQPRVIRNAYTQNAYGLVVREERVSDPPFEEAPTGTPPLSIVAETDYAENVDRWIHDLPSRITVSDSAGQLIYAESRFYDGERYVGLPVGQVERGNLSRQEQFALPLTQAESAYPTLTADDWGALGYTLRSDDYPDSGYTFDRARFAFDAHGNVIGKLSPTGFETTIELDDHSLLPRRVVNGLSHEASAVYDYQIQKPTSYTDENGGMTHSGYDPIGRLTTLRRPGDEPDAPGARFAYHDAVPPHRIVSELHDAELGRTFLRHEYLDASGQPLQIRQQAADNQVQVSSWLERNSYGLVKHVYQPFYSTTLDYVQGERGDPDLRLEAHFDVLGRPLGSQRPDGVRTSAEYTAWGITYRDGNDNDDSPAGLARGHVNTPRTERYDAWLRTIEVVENLNGVDLATRYHYDLAGRITRVVDPAHRDAIDVAYDLSGRKLAITQIDTGTRQFRYDADGHVVWEKDANGATINRTYDTSGRLVAVHYGDPATDPEEEFHFDGDPSQHAGHNLLGRLAWLVDRSGETHFSYDARGNIERRTKILADSGEVLSMQYQYNDRDQLKAITYPGGRTVSYDYDSGGMLRGVGDAIRDAKFNAAGQKISETWTNGVETTYSYDPITFQLQETKTRHPDLAMPFRHLGYRHDPNGNLETIQDLIGTSASATEAGSFAYDSLYRLVRAEGTDAVGAYVHHFAYDDAGNHRLNEDLGNGELVYDGGAAGNNRLTGRVLNGAIVEEYAYDANGNVIASPVHQEIRYDARGRLERAVRRDGTVIELKHDFTGQRASKRVTQATSVKDYVYLDGLIEIEVGQLREFITDLFFAIEQHDAPGDRSFLHRDFRHSTVLMTDALDGSQEQVRVAYYPFGRTSSSQGPRTPHRLFIGQPYDADLELYYFRSRYYDPRLGRFIQPDPMLIKFLSGIGNQGVLRPGNLNLYVYAYNNPETYIDPSGELAWFIPIIIGVVIGAYVGGTVSSGSANPVDWSAKDWGFAAIGGVVGGLLGGASVLLSTIPMYGALLSSSFNFGIISATGALLGGEHDAGDLALIFGAGFASGIVSGTGGFGLAYSGWLGRYAAQIVSTSATNALLDWAKTGQVDRLRFGLHGFSFSTNFQDFSFDGINSAYWISQGATLLNGLVGYAAGNGGLGWDTGSLSVMSRGGVVGWIQGSEFAGFSVYSVGHYNDFTKNHELTHLWQARIMGELWGIHYLANLLTLGYQGNHYEAQAYEGDGFY